MRTRWITDWTPSARWPHYTRANAGEVLPTPASPLGWSFSWEKGMILGWANGYARSGNYDRWEMDARRPEVIGSFGGYFYINLSNVRMQGVRNPAVTVEQLDLAFFGADPNVPPYKAHPDDEQPEYTDRILAHLGWVMTATEWPEIDAHRAEAGALRASRPDLSTQTSDELVARARATQPLLDKYFEVHAVSSSSSGIAPGILFAVGQAIGDPEVPMKLLASLGGVDSAAPSFALWELSRIVRRSAALTKEFEAGIDKGAIIGRIRTLRETGDRDAAEFLEKGEAFLHEYGSRGPNEWEVHSETWETDPAMALAAVDRIRLQTDEESPTLRSKRNADSRGDVTNDVRAKLAALGPDEADIAGQFEAALNAANFMSWRERTKTNIVKVVHEGRMVFREFGRRAHDAGHLNDPKDVFMLLDTELEAFAADPAPFKQILTDRAAEWHELWTLEPPFFIKDGYVPPIPAWPKRGTAAVTMAVPGEVLQGVSGAPGVARGRARIILDPADPFALEPGDILVAPLTDPAWTPLFMAAAGVVVNVGGQISHAVIVSRELGLPCAISVPDATLRIPDGAMIEVNGSTGAVTLL